MIFEICNVAFKIKLKTKSNLEEMGTSRIWAFWRQKFSVLFFTKASQQITNANISHRMGTKKDHV